MKKLTKSKYKKILVILAKLYAKHRDKFICQKCWTKTNIHWSHIIPVSADWRLAICIDNIKSLCFHCHMNRWHKNPIESWEWIRKKRPDRIKKLEQQHIENMKWWTISIVRYKEQAQEMIDKFKTIKILPKYKVQVGKLLKQLEKDLI